MSEEPVEIPKEIPKTLTASRRFGDQLFVAGTGPKLARLMFVATSVLEEEHQDYIQHSYGRQTKDPARYLKGPSGSILSNLTNAVGLDMDGCYYTALIKWLAPKARRLRPTKEMIQAATPLLHWEVQQADPDIIVCMGKPVFDLLSGTKFKLHDIAGGWFQAEIGGRMRRLYPMECVTRPVLKPEYTERFRMDLREVRRMFERVDGVYVESYEQHYETISTKDQLVELVNRLEEQDRRVLSVDCEWHGPNHIDGQLRSLQICWAPGYAAYIRFMDDQLNYALDVPYAEAGQILSRWLDRPEVRYVGHHISADLPWMAHVLGLRWYDKTILDTEFAQQCVEESSEVGLERLCMSYTDLGRWDIPIEMWKKRNPGKTKDGYGLIPDEVLIEYALKDCDGVMRSYPHIMRRLVQEHGGSGFIYYQQIFNPFVTNIFTSFVLYGLPIDRQRIDHLRELYHYMEEQLHTEFLSLIATEAEQLLATRLDQLGCGPDIWENIRIMEDEDQLDEAERLLYTAIPAEQHLEIKCVWEHYKRRQVFNIKSADQLRPWLFEVKGMQPVKSTNRKEKGLPSMPWEKVLELPKDKQREFSPSTDAQTLEILGQSYKDPTLRKLLEYKAVSTTANSLGMPVLDEDGTVIEEQGHHRFITSQDTMVGMWGTTETGRPRSSKPNTLNLASWVNNKITNAMAEILMLRLSDGTLPPQFAKYAVNPKLIPSVRSIVTAKPYWCIVESDYKTAELLGWSYISGDQQMIDLITKPDLNFARVKPEKMVDEDCVCRLAYPDYIEGDYPQYVMTYTTEGRVKATFTEEDLLRDDQHQLVHTGQDLHWSLAEMMHGKPREVMSKKGIRGAAKTANFSSAYGASGNTLDRKIEADTGITPDPGTGDKLLETLMDRQPRAFAFMEEMERVPKEEGYIIAQSGRIRHFHLHDPNTVNYYMYKGQASALGRESRNFLMQESVGSTAARAANWLLKFKFKFELEGRPTAVLYDSVVTLSPNHERHVWKAAHDLFMWLANGWLCVENRVLRYPVDHELNQSWSFAPTPDQQKLIDSSPESDRPNVREAAKWLAHYIELVRDDEQLSVEGADWMFEDKNYE